MRQRGRTPLESCEKARDSFHWIRRFANIRSWSDDHVDKTPKNGPDEQYTLVRELNWK